MARKYARRIPQVTTGQLPTVGRGARSRTTGQKYGPRDLRQRLARPGIRAPIGGKTSTSDIDALVAAMLESQAAGGGRGFSFGETQAGAEFERQAALEQLRLQQEFEQRMTAEAAARAEQARVDNLKNERAALFAEKFGIDPVRAILLGKGISGDLVGMDTARFGELPALEGIGQRETETEAAISKAIGPELKSTIDINEQGVTGLPSVENIARQIQYGGEDIMTVLRSAFGVGSKALGGGVSADDFLRRIQEVTPRGAL